MCVLRRQKQADSEKVVCVCSTLTLSGIVLVIANTMTVERTAFVL